MRELKVKQVQQPTAHTCVHACLSMVTGVPVEEYIERFGDTALGQNEETVALVENGIFPVAVPYYAPHPFPEFGVYFVTAPSVNTAGYLHRVIVTVSEDGYDVYDPNLNREGMKAYIDMDDLPRTEVTFLCPKTLEKMQDFGHGCR